MSHIKYAEVLSDLRERRDKLNAIIAGIEEVMGSTDIVPPVPKKKTPRKLKTVTASKPSKAVNTKALSVGEPSISDLIRQAAKESLRTSTEIADRVQQVRPAVDRNSVSTLICQLVKSGELRKDDQLKVHFIPKRVNGAAAHT